MKPGQISVLNGRCLTAFVVGTGSVAPKKNPMPQKAVLAVQTIDYQVSSCRTDRSKQRKTCRVIAHRLNPHTETNRKSP